MSSTKIVAASIYPIKGIACSLCLFILSIVMVFASTTYWMQILLEEGNSFTGKKLTSQHTAVELTIIKISISKPYVSLKRLTSFLRKGLFKESQKEIYPTQQICQKIPIPCQLSRPFLTDRSFDLFKLSILSSKHHPPTIFSSQV